MTRRGRASTPRAEPGHVLAEISSSCALAIAGAMLALWLLSLALRDASIVDVWWGPGIALAAFVALLSADAALSRSHLLRVSGVALLERSIGKRRPEYAEYQRRAKIPPAR